MPNIAAQEVTAERAWIRFSDGREFEIQRPVIDAFLASLGGTDEEKHELAIMAIASLIEAQGLGNLIDVEQAVRFVVPPDPDEPMLLAIED